MRATDAILDEGKAYNLGGGGPALSIHRGGMNNYIPNYGVWENGKLIDNFQNAHIYVKQNLIPIVLKTPLFFDYMPDSEFWVKAYKSIIQDRPQSISGLKSGLTVDVEETPIGGSGEMLQSITDVKRERSQPSFEIPDIAGRSIQRFLNALIRFGMKDPDTKKPLASLYFDTREEMQVYTPDYYSGIVIFIEPDITQQIVYDAWLCMNFFPLSDGSREGKRDLTSAGEKNVLSIEWAATTTNNEATMILGQKILDRLGILELSPDTAIVPPVEDVDPALRDLNEGYGKRR